MLGFVFTLGLHEDCYQLQVDFCHLKLVKMPKQKKPDRGKQSHLCWYRYLNLWTDDKLSHTPHLEHLLKKLKSV